MVRMAVLTTVWSSADRNMPGHESEHHQLDLPWPMIGSDDGNAPEIVAVMDVEREIVPPAPGSQPSNASSTTSSRTALAPLTRTCSINWACPIQVCLAQDTADVEPEGVRTFASQCDWHDSGSLRRGSPRP